MSNYAIKHMNEDHKDVVELLFKKYAFVEDSSGAEVIGLDSVSITIQQNDKKINIPFLTKVDENFSFKDVIIELYNSVKDDDKNDKIQGQMLEFIQSFKTVLISSLDDEQCVTSYAPFVKIDNDIYVVISSVARHYHSIKQNPNKVSLMFLQDEKDAKTIFARVRAGFEVEATFCDELKDRVFDELEKINPKETALKHIKTMNDFHIIKFKLKNGRFVKGFGGAYDTFGLKILGAAKTKNPHDYKK
ncbi:iron-responsive cellular heme oxygenase [Campylobacter blaseri]|uniref:HugZ family heme oxygenase n=1 Tax=Campylobacter blaseri TaxID=2042961 RepID=A0A2P8R3H7_9BACT|nr:HugZ family heme oxygenase [Campylobacter blaseri]PSM53053.1 HugZ family heme oxygenase [Campylobacter blaseri]PSM54520.1 HugZ family heme oxygenase [Campylobacter blaseri]QKF85233.1 iron-responsive cellular heme oxygenase [Campylobacter blaseri]